MKIGVRAHDYGKQTMEDMASLLHKKGYDCAQLAFVKAFKEADSYEDLNEEMMEKARKIFSDAGIEISVMGCYMDLGNPDEEIRKQAVKTFKRCLQLNQILGAKVVGTETAYPHLDGEGRKKWKPYMLESIKEITDAAAHYDQKAAIEPVWWHPLEDLETVREVMEEIHDERHLRMIFDASNLLKDPDHTDQNAYWSEWLKHTGKYIEAMHIKDFRLDAEGKYVPVALGEGVIDYTAISSWLHENRKDMPLLREEMNPENDQADIAYLCRM
jgi:sugar phosphate isomerase/epimerase